MELTPAEVSVLFPLPSNLSSTSALRLDSSGVHGALLTKSRFDALPAFRPTGPNDTAASELAYARFRVVGLRVDPCSPDATAVATAPGTCRQELRLVAQPLFETPSAPTTSARDSAIHLVYGLDDASFGGVLSNLRKLRKEHGASEPRALLGPHPALVREGEGGPAGELLRATILAAAGEARLTRVTFMLGDGLFTWSFGGFDVGASGMTRIAIFGLSPTPDRAEQAQLIVASGEVLSVSPTSTDSRALQPLFGVPDCGPIPTPGCPTFKLERTASEIRTALQGALDVENPARRNSETSDCVSCHLAGPLRDRASTLGHSTAGLSAFAVPSNLVAPSAANARQLRAFGYFDSTPVVSQRTVNESISVVSALRALPGKK